MTKMWCIYCQTEREHAGDNYLCSACGRDTLANIQPSLNDAGHSLVMQMVGEAQRIAMNTGQRGDIKVSRLAGNESEGFRTQILVYNTYTQYYRTRVSVS